LSRPHCSASDRAAPGRSARRPTRPAGGCWPEAPEGGFAGLLTLRDLALSVSGSLGQWTEIGGRRYGHVLDPRSGQALTRRREALVVAPTASLAEALSTALLVLGEAEGPALVASQPGCESLLLDAGRGCPNPPLEGREPTCAAWSAGHETVADAFDQSFIIGLDSGEESFPGPRGHPLGRWS
jgi:hypothetical protein